MTKRRRVLLFSMPVAALIAWFVMVDRSWFVERCPACGYSRDIVQVRILTHPISEWSIDFETTCQKAAVDLGVECHHAEINRWHKHRYWGLWYCRCPCVNGTYRLVGGEYDARTTVVIREMMRRNPDLPQEFKARVLLGNDMDYLSSFWDQARAIDQELPKSGSEMIQ